MNSMHDVAMRIEKFDALDGIAEPLADTVKKLIPPGRLKDLLSGTWLGHQLHPLLTDIPIGAFTGATVLDLVGGRRAQPAANLLATARRDLGRSRPQRPAWPTGPTPLDPVVGSAWFMPQQTWWASGSTSRPSRLAAEAAGCRQPHSA